jgi:hypothetical protein
MGGVSAQLDGQTFKPGCRRSSSRALTLRIAAVARPGCSGSAALNRSSPWAWLAEQVGHGLPHRSSKYRASVSRCLDNRLRSANS